MKNTKNKDKLKDKTIAMDEIIDQYTVTGVPASSIPRLCKELGVKKSDLNKWLAGQTSGMVGGEALIYPWDLKRFIRGLPVID